MLRVSLIGNLGTEPETRYSQKGSQITTFRVAINQVRTNAAGQPEESTEWFRINVAGRQAEFASRLQKGQRVLIEGRLQISHFKRQDGTAGVGYDVWADEVQNVSARTADTDDGHTTVGTPATSAADEPPEEEDLPF